MQEWLASIWHRDPLYGNSMTTTAYGRMPCDGTLQTSYRRRPPAFHEVIALQKNSCPNQFGKLTTPRPPDFPEGLSSHARVPCIYHRSGRGDGNPMHGHCCCLHHCEQTVTISGHNDRASRQSRVFKSSNLRDLPVSLVLH